LDQKEADLDPSTQTAVAEDKRLRWKSLEAALMLFSCSFRSELRSPSGKGDESADGGRFLKTGFAFGWEVSFQGR
jgi:hypothetical protein